MANLKELLSNMIDKINAKAGTDALKGLVKSVNGTLADEEGNVSVSGLPEGATEYQQLVTDADGVAKWEDKLAYSQERVKVSVSEFPVVLYKVSDNIPDFLQGISSGDSFTLWCEGANFKTVASLVRDEYAIIDELAVGIAYKDNAEVVGDNTTLCVFPERGVYFGKTDSFPIAGVAPADATKPVISWDGSVDSVKTIDPKYLPEDAALKGEITPRIDEVESAANNAQTTADNAQTTADNAQATADNAQTAADNAQTTADNKSKYDTVKITTPIAFTNPKIIYADGKFLIIPSYSSTRRALYSTDGITWNETNICISGYIQMPIYADGKFVAVSRSSIAAYSTDGITWTETTLPADQFWQQPVYADGKFVVFPDGTMGSSSIAAYSTDGITWTETTLPADQDWYQPIYADGKFVAVGSSSIAAYSTDGITWTETAMPADKDWLQPVYADGKFVAFPDGTRGSSSIAAYSTDGITWTETTLPAIGRWRQPVYADGKFVAVSRSSIAAYSTDGITWTETTLPADQFWYQPIYADGKFVAVSDTNYISTGVIPSPIAAYSIDGITWTETALPDNEVWSPPLYADGKFVLTPYYKYEGTPSSIAAYSTDGITWTETTLPAIEKWCQPIYADGKFVLVAAETNNSVAYSTDGITWHDSYAYISQNGEDITEKVKDLLLTDTAAKSDIPTNVSELENDAGYITAEEVPEGFSGSYNDLTDKPEIPSSWSDFGNREMEYLYHGTIVIENGTAEITGLSTSLTNGVEVAVILTSEDGNAIYDSAMTYVYNSMANVSEYRYVSGHKVFDKIDCTSVTRIGMGSEMDDGNWILEIYDPNQDRINEIPSQYIPSTIARVEDIPDPIQADYTQNDPEQPDYIKNRLAYTTREQVTHEFVTIGIYNLGYASLPYEFFPGNGEEYAINWDGTDYTATAAITTVDEEEVMVVGSTSFFGGSTNTDIPFGIISRSGRALVYSSESGEHTISLTGYEQIPHKIPREYVDHNPIVGVIDSSYYNYRYLNPAKGASIAEVRQAAVEGNRDIIIRLDLDNWQGTLRYMGLTNVSTDGTNYVSAMLFSTIKANNVSINDSDEAINGTMQLEYWYALLEPAEGPPADAFVNFQFAEINLAPGTAKAGYYMRVNEDGFWEVTEGPDFIKTVNGVSPDADGNITIDIPTDEHVNELITTAIAAIPAAEEASF